MQIFFLIQTSSKHVTSAPWKQRSAVEARRVSRERPFLLQWITEFRTRDDKFREFPRPFLLNDIAIFDRVLGGSNPVFYFYLLFVGFIVRSYV